MSGLKQGKYTNSDLSADLSVLLGDIPAKITIKQSDISQLTCSEITKNTHKHKNNNKMEIWFLIIEYNERATVKS